MPCALIIFEDEHLLVINKPAGVNTHAPSPFAGEGIYEWLKNREPRWATLAIIQRLDKETSGVMVFGKTPLANRSLTEQFTNRSVKKKYLLLTKADVSFREVTVKSTLSRVGDKYVSRPAKPGDELAETLFRVVEKSEHGTLVEAKPVTGRTHQIRVHAAANQFPILGDVLYGGTAFQRVCLHAAELSFAHPATEETMTFAAPPDFLGSARITIRESTINLAETNSFRLIHGASDGWPGWYVEKLGDYLLSQSENALSPEQNKLLHEHVTRLSLHGVYHKSLNRHVRGSNVKDACPQLLIGEKATEEFTIRENGIRFGLSFDEGYSVGLFLDQRENRRRFLTHYVAPDFSLPETYEVLNTFAYTCGFSVCAAKGGARTTSLDLSKKYLEWGKRNFALNGLSTEGHDFIFGDVFDWLRRLGKKGRAFDAIVLDPPTFSQSKESGVFRAEKDYGKLIQVALPLLKPKGVFLASTNCATLEPEKFLEMIHAPIAASGRKILQQQYVP
ncbi:MAG: Pseudouridine synthase, partial [Verrucomicrobiales bacterium]|nr:Pseudouridine synthase [Verrucomicrobiales bacterium]